jgi:hypothetical protein
VSSVLYPVSILTRSNGAVLIGQSTAANALPVNLNIDCDGTETTITATLSASPWTALSPRISIPDTASRAIITAPAGLTRYRLNADPGGAPSGTSSAGATIRAGDQRVITLAAGTSRTLGLSSALASGVVTVEFVP